MAKLVRAVHVTDPNSGRRLVLQPGEEPAAHLAALITTPSAWEDGRVPDTGTTPAGDDGGKAKDADAATGDDHKAAPEAKKTAARKSAASKPARGRDAAEQGDSGE